MRVIIVRRVRGGTLSMDIYADNLVAGLKAVRPHWEIVEIAPEPWNRPDQLYLKGPGFRKYYETYWRYPAYVSRHQADIFHIIDHTDGHIIRWLAKHKKASVITCHDLVQFVYPESLKGQSRLPALSFAIWRHSVWGMRQASHIIAVSSNTAKDVQKFLSISPEHITVALNGINPQFRMLSRDSVSNFRQEHGTTDDTLCLLNVGETSPRKNIMAVLKVFAALDLKGIPVRLWKVGGEFRQDHQEFIEQHNLRDKIVHFVKPDNQTLEKIYNTADLLIAPSLYEGFGLTVLEAMACGLPVVTANCSSLPEVAGNAAILVDPTDVEAISTAILQIWTDQQYRQHLIDQGLIRAKQFNWQNTAEQIAQVYEAVYSQVQTTGSSIH